jgi:hypothetical protein
MPDWPEAIATFDEVHCGPRHGPGSNLASVTQCDHGTLAPCDGLKPAVHQFRSIRLVSAGEAIDRRLDLSTGEDPGSAQIDIRSIFGLSRTREDGFWRV